MKKEEIISIIKYQKPTVVIYKIENSCVVYRTTVSNKLKRIPETQPVFFNIPFSEIKDTLNNVMNSNDIIKWLVVI